MTDQQRRRENLEAWIPIEIFDRAADLVVSDPSAYVPRYLLLTRDGDNAARNLTLHETLFALTEQANAEANEDPSWTPSSIIDLSDNAEITWTTETIVSVNVEAG